MITQSMANTQVYLQMHIQYLVVAYKFREHTHSCLIYTFLDF